MPAILPIGTFFPQNAAGHILNPTRFDLIPKHWLPAVYAVKKSFFDHFAGHIHSIWLRGSVPRGMAIDGTSDLDCFVLLHQKKEEHWESVHFEAVLEKELCQKYPFIAAIEAKKSTILPNLAAEKPKIAMLIKTQSLCLYGQDIRSSLPDYFPDKSMMLNYHWLESDLDRFLSIAEPTAKDFQAISKVILRVGFELVMERVGSYTTDLYLCYRTFTQFYPSKDREMLLFLDLFVNPMKVKPEISTIGPLFGKWLVKEVSRVLV